MRIVVVSTSGAVSAASRVPRFHRTALKCRQNVVNILEQRGLLEALTSEQLRVAWLHLKVPPLKVYCGFDPTAESLHLGNLLGLIVLSWFQRCGHHSVALIGRVTALRSDGTKFGKSEDSAIWLSLSMLSPYKFYQYFFSVSEVDIVRFLMILTFMDMNDVRQIKSDMKSLGYLPNTAQRRLAEEVTRFVHGQDGLDEVLKATEELILN